MSEYGGPQPPRATAVTALILAGGAGRRVGGRDKGLLPWRGRPLVEHVYRCIEPQVASVLISCNRNRDAYARICRVSAPDRRANFQGPLAGLEAAAPELRTEFVLLVPCDMPQLPDDLVQRLLHALRHAPGSYAAYAETEARQQYLCALLHRRCLPGLSAFLDSGERAVYRWYATLGSVGVNFADRSEHFLNINRIERQ